MSIRPHHIVHRAHNVVFKYSRCVNRLAAHRRLIESQLDIQPTPQPTCVGCSAVVRVCSRCCFDSDSSFMLTLVTFASRYRRSTSLYSGSWAVTAVRLSRACPHPSQSLLVRTVTSNTDQTAGGHKLVWIQVFSTYATYIMRLAELITEFWTITEVQLLLQFSNTNASQPPESSHLRSWLLITNHCPQRR